MLFFATRTPPWKLASLGHVSELVTVGGGHVFVALVQVVGVGVSADAE